jgi:hypothetical protein
MHDHPTHYCAYLLRCWEVSGHDDADGSVWRFSLENPHTDERRGFASFEALLAVLRDELALPIVQTGDDAPELNE